MEIQTKLSHKIALIAIISALSIHIIITIIYLLPINPVTLRTQTIIQGYMLPLFEQNWQLFAPNPVSETRVILVQCRLREHDNQIIETAWQDITTPYWEQHVTNRLSPADRIVRAHTHTARIIYGSDPLVLRLEEHRTEEDSPLNQVLDEVKHAEQEQHRTATEALQRIASAHCDLVVGLGRTDEVRVKLALLEFPRFSERDKPDEEGELRHYILEWMPYQHVAPLADPSAS